MSLYRTITIMSLLAAGSFSQAQTHPEDQALRLLKDGRADIASGRGRQGLDALLTIVSGFPNSPYVDDALLDIGKYAEEEEKNPARAREVYDEIAKRYPQGDAAPGAYLQMGRMAWASGAHQSALDEALTCFQRVIRLYPESPFVPQALAASSAVHLRAGRYDAAIDAAQRTVQDHPGSDIAPDAQFGLALALAMAGDVERSMEEFQRTRILYPSSPLAERALLATTALYRIHGREKPVFVLDPGFSSPTGDVLRDVRSMAVTPSGVTWIASSKTRSAISYDRGFKLGAALYADDPQTLSISPAGEVVFASKLTVKTGAGEVFLFSSPGDKPGAMEPIDRIGAATRLISGDTLISDLRHKRVLRFKGTNFANFFPDRMEREVIKLLTTPRGEAVMLRKDDKSIEVIDADGRLISKIGPRGSGYEWKKPVDLALDAFSNLYLADEDQGIFMLSPKGQLMAVFGAAEVRKSRAVAIDPAGAVLVYDDRAETIVRFK